MKPTKIGGRVWVIPEHDIDTDMIFHNRHLAITDLKQMGQFTFGNLKGWEDFPKRARKGDIVVVGDNFGSGSSRQQAVDCFRSLGISFIICQSVGAIYKRNAINSGFPLLICPGILDSGIESGHELEVNMVNGEIKNLTKDRMIKAQPFSRVQMDIYQAGNLFEYGKKLQ
ncbi:3-isopropylmalate dehydratase [candidate division KSB1 bacterium]|nr:3-isopropylmalate dehydratase [candidate division KSB1 bacterium]